MSGGPGHPVPTGPDTWPLAGAAAMVCNAAVAGGEDSVSWKRATQPGRVGPGCRGSRRETESGRRSAGFSFFSGLDDRCVLAVARRKCGGCIACLAWRPGTAIGEAPRHLAASSGARFDVVATVLMEDTTQLRRTDLLDETDGGPCLDTAAKRIRGHPGAAEHRRVRSPGLRHRGCHRDVAHAWCAEQAWSRAWRADGSQSSGSASTRRRANGRGPTGSFSSSNCCSSSIRPGAASASTQ